MPHHVSLIKLCGIAGFLGNDDLLLRSMTKSLAHRGPDGIGFYSDGIVELGHTRLSIVDLSERSAQPMESSNGEAVIVFNGEIYNYLEKRIELESRGYHFRTESDTEVLLSAYLDSGIECLSELNGMWAFCIYDVENKCIILSRDRIGKKPLYYHTSGGGLFFSSEMKSLLLTLDSVEIDPVALQIYLTVGYIPSPMSIFKEIRKLEPSSYLRYSLETKQIDKGQYSSPLYYSPRRDSNVLRDEVRETLRDSVEKRNRADVPIGAFLSGGLDSTLITSLMRALSQTAEIQTFSMGFDGEYDESMYAQIASDYFHTDHHSLFFSEDDFHRLLPLISGYFDEPFADYSNFPIMKLSHEASKSVKVVMTGDGGDEVFGGYPHYRLGAAVNMSRSFSKLFLHGIRKSLELYGLTNMPSAVRLRRAVDFSISDDSEFPALIMGFGDFVPEDFHKWSVQSMNLCTRLARNDLIGSLIIYDQLFGTLADNYLVKVDRASMSAGLEARNPLLDYRLMSLSQSIPSDKKVNLFETKIMMREIARELMPRVIVDRKKMGFTPPILKWILQSNVMDSSLLSTIDWGNKGIFDHGWMLQIEKIRGGRQRTGHSDLLAMRILMLQNWLDFWFDGAIERIMSINHHQVTDRASRLGHICFD